MANTFDYDLLAKLFVIDKKSESSVFYDLEFALIFVLSSLSSLSLCLVDPVGVEPTSKQGITKFSTCLFCNWFSMMISPQTGKLLT